MSQSNTPDTLSAMVDEWESNPPVVTSPANVGSTREAFAALDRYAGLVRRLLTVSSITRTTKALNSQRLTTELLTEDDLVRWVGSRLRRVEKDLGNARVGVLVFGGVLLARISGIVELPDTLGAVVVLSVFVFVLWSWWLRRDRARWKTLMRHLGLRRADEIVFRLVGDGTPHQNPYAVDC